MSQAKRGGKRRASFGLALGGDSRSIPLVVSHLIEYFDNRGLGNQRNYFAKKYSYATSFSKGCDDEGIFRISAKIDDVDKLRKAMDKEKPTAVDLSAENIHVLANLLKLYFRELPEPLLTFECYSPLVNVASKNTFFSVTKLFLIWKI